MDPPNANQFEVAIICPLRCEYNAVELLLDDRDKSTHFSRRQGDLNMYTTGRIAEHPVVLVRLSRIGNAEAAATTASLRSSFPRLSLVLIAGICGGVSTPERELLLGDVVVSKSVVQYGIGRQFPDHFEVATRMDSALGGPPKAIANFVAKLETGVESVELQERAADLLRELQAKDNEGVYRYPGAGEDRLFETSHRHKHPPSASCSICNACLLPADPVCPAARDASCASLGCGPLVSWRKRHPKIQSLERRGRTDDAQERQVHFGCVASASRVLMSGEERDTLARELAAHAGFPVLAFEMEAAGVWNELPCVVVKGVCDYADSHKNKGWQDFASATAACVARAMVERWPRTIVNDGEGEQPQERAEEAVRSGVRGAVYHGPVSGKNIVSQVFGNGGSHTTNFQ